MKLKKTFWYSLFIPLAFASVLVLGYLSFIGTLGLTGILALGIVALGFTMAYEGQVYLQNIKGAINKLFLKKDYFRNKLGKEFIYKNFPLTDPRPQIFIDQLADLDALETYSRFTLSKQDSRKRNQLKQQIKQREKLLLSALLDKEQRFETEYVKQARQFFHNKANKKSVTGLKQRINSNQTYNRIAIFFSILVASGMGVGTIFLLAGQFLFIPFIPLAIVPTLVITLGVLSGVAYGLLIYNALTDMIGNSTLQKWRDKIANYKKDKQFGAMVLVSLSAALLIGLALVMTVFTMGTWWYIIKAAAPLIPVLYRIPGILSAVISSIIGFSALIFNIENSFETLALFNNKIKGWFKKSPDSDQKQSISWREKLATRFNVFIGNEDHQENTAQKCNIFRLWLVIVIGLIDKISFFIHLIGEGLCADGMPGVPSAVPAVTGVMSSGMADLHYFFGHEHDRVAYQKGLLRDKALIHERLHSMSGHNHNGNIPSLIIKFIFSGFGFVYLGAALWDWAMSEANSGTTKRVLTFKDAWRKQVLNDPLSHNSDRDGPLPNVQSSPALQTELVVRNIERYKQGLSKPVLGKPIAESKIEALEQLQTNLLIHEEQGPQEATFTEHKKNYQATYAQHRYGIFNTKPTTTALYVDKLSQYACAASA